MPFQSSIQRGAERLQFPLVFLVDNVDLGVVGDVPQGDVGHALVHEALADVAVGGHLRRVAPGQLGLLDLSVPAIGQDVVGVTGAHDAGAGQGQGDAGGVDGDPPPPPLLGHVGGGAGAAGGVQHKVAWISGHQNATLDQSCRRLHHINFGVRPALYTANIIPRIVCLNGSEVVKVSDVRKTVARHFNAVRL